MRIQHNITAANAARQLGGNNSAVSKNLEKLSSGYKINRAGDDAAGLAISEKMRSQIRGLETASKNANDGISLIQTAEGALTEVHSMLNRMVELATQSSNGTYTDADRSKLQDEVTALRSEIDRISEGTNFNGINLLDGSLGGGKAGSSAGTVFTGASIAKFDAAEVKGAGIAATFATATATANKQEHFSVDGQTLDIEWSKSGDSKTMYDAIVAWDGTGTKDAAKDFASKLTDFFNGQIKEQGLSGSVKITSDGTDFYFASTNTSSKSEFSYLGTDDSANAATAVGTLIFKAATAGDAVKSTAKMTYNGEALASGDTFVMKINGVESKVSLTAAIAKGADLTGNTVSGALQTAVQNAVKNYNTQYNLTKNVKDPTSGLTGVDEADFTASFDKDGSLIVKYNGDVKDVSFSFSDVGDKTIASSLGLSSGTSKVGGGRGLTLQVGDTSDSFQKVTVSVDSMSARSLGIGDINIGTETGAGDAISKINAAINTVSTTRGNLGALQNRLEHTVNNLGVTTENMTAAESRIRDVDMAKEMMDFTKNNILTQAAQSMLAQANQLPQGVLQLLR